MPSTLYIMTPGEAAPSGTPATDAADQIGASSPATVKYVKVGGGAHDLRNADDYKGIRYPNQGGIPIGLSKLIGSYVITNWFLGNIEDDPEVENILKFLGYMLGEHKRDPNKYSLFYWNQGTETAPSKDSKRQLWDTGPNAYVDYYGVFKDYAVQESTVHNITVKSMVFDIYYP